MSDDAPAVDGRPPADVVTAMVERVLALVRTWPAWDGTPMTAPVEGEPEPRLYTPHKAVRRVADHLVDHLAELEARAAGRPTEPDHWHGSMVTTPADLAAFTADDADEAASRLRRLALLWEARLRSMSAAELDAPHAGAWTPRQIAFHVADSVFYAESVGDLSLSAPR